MGARRARRGGGRTVPGGEGDPGSAEDREGEEREGDHGEGRREVIPGGINSRRDRRDPSLQPSGPRRGGSGQSRDPLRGIPGGRRNCAPLRTAFHICGLVRGQSRYLFSLRQAGAESVRSEWDRRCGLFGSDVWPFRESSPASPPARETSCACVAVATVLSRTDGQYTSRARPYYSGTKRSAASLFPPLKEAAPACRYQSHLTALLL